MLLDGSGAANCMKNLGNRTYLAANACIGNQVRIRQLRDSSIYSFAQSRRFPRAP